MRLVHLGANFQSKVKKWLINFLKAKIDLFEVSLDEMPEIYPSVAYHQLNIDPFAQYVAQQRR